jgi:hypothetical protein
MPSRWLYPLSGIHHASQLQTCATFDLTGYSKFLIIVSEEQAGVGNRKVSIFSQGSKSTDAISRECLYLNSILFLFPLQNISGSVCSLRFGRLATLSLDNWSTTYQGILDREKQCMEQARQTSHFDAGVTLEALSNNRRG